MKNARCNDLRFDGAGLVLALVNVGCFIAGLVIGGFASTVLQ